ncbi:MAG: NADH-quinone oxidoreductase subunit C [Candidatus Dadabacteria bacterium]|nr:MAG: NADH-quinone oxidoreductase subunit C [Candidatus Dadabacteria bacterium]
MQNKKGDLLKKIQEKIGACLIKASINLDHPEILIKRENMLDVFKILKADSELDFNMLLDVTAIDWLDKKEKRFTVVYHLLSLTHKHRLRVKIDLDENNPEVDSLCSLWKSANFLERETWDMYGIKFKGHPDLRRILMYDEFKGYPLRKDYPVQKKQPRVPLRRPERENTARLMHRPELGGLVQINKRINKA